MKRSRSGTPPQAEGLRGQTVFLLVALAVVIAFAASAIFGLRGSDAEEQVEPRTASRSLPGSAVSDARGRVEILNGAGTPGLAKLATEKLREAGFDVVQFGNARKRTDTSSVLDRVGNPELATSVGRALGIGRVETVIDTTRFVDATVIIGKDWTQKPRTPQ